MPGTGPGGQPAAIALTPILSARYREADLERIRRVAPAARLVSVSLEGLTDESLDDVEVLLRGPLPAATFDRLLGALPQPALGPLGDRGRRARAHAGSRPARLDHHQRAGRSASPSRNTS
ncbi:MAG: hypothetical protein U0869_06965 [Chloroflexota bacterium]